MISTSIRLPRRLVSLVVGVLAATNTKSSMVAAELTTVERSANGFTFDCLELSPDSGDASASNGGQIISDDAINVMMLHGFPYSRFWYQPLLELWEEQDQNVHALACDLRGYSPGAQPDSIEAYSDTKLFVDDVMDLARATFTVSNGNNEDVPTFHLIGHDHGAILGWLTASLHPDQILSYTAMSVPHNDQFSDALCGPNVDLAQVVASNYFNQWSEENPATEEMFATIGQPLLNFSSIENMRLAMHWYYAAKMYVAMPRVVNDTEVELYASDPSTVTFIYAVREANPIKERPCMPQTSPLGAIDTPVLLVCGTNDTFVLCTREQYQSPPADLLPDYQYYEAMGCEHSFFLPEYCGGNATVSMEVMEEITSFVLVNNAEPSPDPDEGSASVVRYTKGAIVVAGSAMFAITFTMIFGPSLFE